MPFAHPHTEHICISCYLWYNHSWHKVQRSGPASAQVRVGCSNNMQLQPPPPPQTSSGSARGRCWSAQFSMRKGSAWKEFKLCWYWSWLLHLAPWPLHLALVVVVLGSNLQWWCVSISHWHNTPLAHVVVSLIATCAGGLWTKIWQHNKFESYNMGSSE